MSRSFKSSNIVSELGRLKKNFCMTISFPLTEKFYIIHNAPPLIVFVLDKCCVLATEIFSNYPKVGTMWDYHKYLLHTHRSFLILVSICSQTPSIPFR